MASRADGSVAANEAESILSFLIQPAPLRGERRFGRRNAPTNLACSVREDTSEIQNSTVGDQCDSQLVNSESEDGGNRGTWSVLPVDIQDLIFSKLELKHLFRAKLLSKFFKDRINSDEFHGCRGEMHHPEGLLTALHFSVGRDDGLWQCGGYDLTTNSWKKLPPFAMLPRLDPTLFKDHSICAAGGIMCANVSCTSSSIHEKMTVFNPLTGRWRQLPPLNHPRSPVLMQMVVDGDSYKIIVAGSARAGNEHLSKITEVFDSRTSMWTVTEDLPGPLFALNEHQTGVIVNGILFCVAILEGDQSGKGVLAYSVDEGKWLPHLTCPLPNSTNLNIVQLVESNGDVVAFSEVENYPYNRNVEHRIDILEEVVSTDSGQGTGMWRNVMSETKAGNQKGLQVYPEYTCVPFGEGKVCIFNTIVHTGIVYDVQSGNQIETLSSPTWSRSGSEMGFFSMNPLTFSFEPSFRGNPETCLQRLPQDHLADRIEHFEVCASGPHNIY